AGPELSDELEAAEREVERLARLLTTLLTLGRGGERPPPRAGASPAGRGGDLPTPGAVVSLADQVEQAAQRWNDRAAQTGHELAVDCRENTFARASAEDLASVRDNLIENAVTSASA